MNDDHDDHGSLYYTPPNIVPVTEGIPREEESSQCQFMQDINDDDECKI